MKYLKSASLKNGKFSAVFENGATSDSHDAAQFFMVMADKDADVDALLGYIQIGQMTNPEHDWKEIKRIAKTFEAQESQCP